MKLSLQKKLKSYSAFAGVVIATSHEAKSQIIFTDEYPNVHLSLLNWNYYMDLNADSVSDFEFIAHTGNSSYYVYVEELPMASGCGIVAGYHAYNQPYGNLIGSSIPVSGWDLAGPGYICNWGCDMWGTSNFIGMQMRIAGEPHYGYVKFRRITDELPGDYAIYEFAVNSVANEAIYSGQLPQPILYSMEADTIFYSVLEDTAITQALGIAFPQTKNITSATVQIDTGYIVGEDSLEFDNQNGLQGSWNAPSGTLTISGGASVAVYEQALQSIKFRNNQTLPTAGVRAIGFSVSNGQPFGVPVSETVFRNIMIPVAMNISSSSITVNNIHLSSNPVKDIATLEIVGHSLGLIQVKVKDATGRKMTEQAFVKNSDRLTAIVEMQHFPPGVYFFDIQMNDERGVVKVVKE